MGNYDYCKLYVNTNRSFDNLKSSVSSILDSPANGRTIESVFLLVDCFVNNARDDGAGFLYWPYYLEVEISEEAEGEKFVGEIQRLIDGLKLNSMEVVASCNFEDKLTT